MKTISTSTAPVANEAKEITRLENLHAQITSDIEALKEKENSLRDYEQRLRQLVETSPRSSQSPIAALPRPNSAPPVDANLDAEWEKYQRAHSLLEAARRGLCDDRMALKERETNLLRLEEQLTRREAWIKVREQELNAAAQLREQDPPPAATKTKTSFTHAPFLAVRNLLTREG